MPCSSRARLIFPAVLAAAVALVIGCTHDPTKEEQEAAKSTVTCRLDGAPLVIRFDIDEVRFLMPSGSRVTLYQVPSPSGGRYINGNMELRGTDINLQLFINGELAKLEDCKHYEIPKVS